MEKDPDAKAHVVVGKVWALHGLRGEIQVEVISDSPGRFSPGGMLYVGGRPREIQRSLPLRRRRVRLKLEGIDSRSEAETLRDAFLTVPEEMVPPLAEDVYYHFQIIGMGVYSREGEYLGEITEILTTGSNDVYVASAAGTELLIPATDDVVLEVDVGKGTMQVDLPEGLRPSS